MSTTATKLIKGSTGDWEMVIGVLHHMSEIFASCHTTCHKNGGAPTARNIISQGQVRSEAEHVAPGYAHPKQAEA